LDAETREKVRIEVINEFERRSGNNVLDPKNFEMAFIIAEKL
jgi:hypothetical protein